MKIWLIETLPTCYDSIAGLIIEASSPQRVRQIAAENSADEGEEVWLDTEKSSVLQIGEGKLEEERIWLLDMIAG